MMEAIIAFLLSGLILIGSGAVETSAACKAGPVPMMPGPQLGYECRIGLKQPGVDDESIFVLVGMIYLVEADLAAEQYAPWFESY